MKCTSKTNYPLVPVSWSEVQKLTRNIANKLNADGKKIDVIVPIIRGGMPIAMLLSSMLKVQEMSCLHIRRSMSDDPNAEFGIPVNKGITNADKIKDANILVVDDTLEFKLTLDYALSILKQYNPKSITIAILYNFNKDTFDSIYSGEEVKESKWVVFPWEES